MRAESCSLNTLTVYGIDGMIIRADTVTRFRNLTGWAMLVCKKRLEECNSDEVVNESQLFELTLKHFNNVEGNKYKLISYKW